MILILTWNLWRNDHKEREEYFLYLMKAFSKKQFLLFLNYLFVYS
jgi:hypothetical protein